MNSLLALLLAAGDPTNVITRVGIEDVGAAIEVTISGSRVPSFTAFTAQGPARFVIDLPDATLQLPALSATPTGAVLREVSSEQRVAEGVRQARVTLAFAGAVEPPSVRVKGNDLIVRIAAAPSAAGEATPATAPSPRLATVAAPSPLLAMAQAPEPSEPARSPESARSPEPAPAPEPAPSPTPASPAEQAPPPAPAPSPEPAPSPAPARSPEPAPTPEAARTAAAAPPPAPAPSPEPAPSPAPARSPEPAPTPEAARTPAAAPIPAPAPSPEPSPSPAPAPSPEPAPASEPAPSPAPVPTPTPASSPAPIQSGYSARQSPAGPPAPLTCAVLEVGFRHAEGASRVFVRTSAAPRFTVREEGSSLVVVLDGAHAARANDLLPLDTSFFPSVVERVVPRRDSAGTRIEIQLRRMVPHRLEIDDGVLAIIFDASYVQPGARR